MQQQKQQVFRVLSVDGGGVRGIIPARLLQAIETRTEKRVFELFDMVIGNSTGGLLALALMVPDGQGGARYTAADMVAFYRQHCPKIFNRSLFRKLKTLGGLTGPRYSSVQLDQLLKELMGATRLSETLKPALITSYSLDRSQPHLWTTLRAQQGAHQDSYLYDVAGATSAAPTYFAPQVIKTKDSKPLHEIDGGIWANNPEFTALVGLKAMGISFPSEDVLMVSLGTGQAKLNRPPTELEDAGIVGWFVKAHLIDMMMHAESEWSDEVIAAIYPHNYRLQVPIAPSLGATDNSSSKNLAGLVQAAEAYISQHDAVIKELCSKLMAP